MLLKTSPKRVSAPKSAKNGASNLTNGVALSGSKEAVSDLLGSARALTADGKVESAVELLVNSAKISDESGAEALYLTAAQIIDSTDYRRAKGYISAALELNPHSGQAHLAMAIVLSNLGDKVGLLHHLKNAVQGGLTPSQSITAAVLLSGGGIVELANQLARESFDKVAAPLTVASDCLTIALQAADWDFVEKLISVLRQGYAAGLSEQIYESPKTNILWCDDETINLSVISKWSKKAFPTVATSCMQVRRLDKRKIRVGYLSSDYRNHPTAWLFAGMLRHHNRNEFELVLYDSGWDDGSMIRKELVSLADKHHSIANLSDEAAATLIASHEIDVLVELNGPTKATRLGVLSRRPAPVQMGYLGWPGSYGGRFVDYIIADEYIVTQDMAQHYPEKIIWLEGTYQINDYQSRDIDLSRYKKTDFGFLENELVVGVFNTINKIRRDVWVSWMTILKQSPDAVLWLLDPGPVAINNLRRETEACDVDPDRIVVANKLPQIEHIQRLAICDLILDPWPVGGHTSAADALYAGVPIVAMRGKSFSSRVNGSLLAASGLEHFVCNSVEDYISFATLLLTDDSFYANLKKLLMQHIKKSAIFNSKNLVNQVESAYLLLVNESAQ